MPISSDTIDPGGQEWHGSHYNPAELTTLARLILSYYQTWRNFPDIFTLKLGHRSHVFANIKPGNRSEIVASSTVRYLLNGLLDYSQATVLREDLHRLESCETLLMTDGSVSVCLWAAQGAKSQVDDCPTLVIDCVGRQLDRKDSTRVAEADAEKLRAERQVPTAFESLCSQLQVQSSAHWTKVMFILYDWGYRRTELMTHFNQMSRSDVLELVKTVGVRMVPAAFFIRLAQLDATEVKDYHPSFGKLVHLQSMDGNAVPVSKILLELHCGLYRAMMHFDTRKARTKTSTGDEPMHEILDMSDMAGIDIQFVQHYISTPSCRVDWTRCPSERKMARFADEYLMTELIEDVRGRRSMRQDRALSPF